jgi:hypothetical protein
MLGFAGIWNSIAGILAISSSRVYTGHSVLVFGSLNTWGWIVLLLGIVQLIASAALFAGSEFARWFGIAAAGVNAIGQLLFLPAYPWWAIAMFAVDLLVIYGLAVHAGLAPARCLKRGIVIARQTRTDMPSTTACATAACRRGDIAVALVAASSAAVSRRPRSASGPRLWVQLEGESRRSSKEKTVRVRLPKHRGHKDDAIAVTSAEPT